jgi:hypothetical protein
MSGKMDQYYTKALACHNDIPYAEFHKYITRTMDNWYRLFPFKKNDDAAEDDYFSGEEGDIVDVPAVDASKVGRSFKTTDGDSLARKMRQVLPTETLFVTAKKKPIMLQPSTRPKRAWLRQAAPLSPLPALVASAAAAGSQA